MGPVRSFLTSLFRMIEEDDLRYKNRNGRYFDIMYNQAIQKPMFEMSGSHIKYIPEICYLYNKDLVNRDKETEMKRLRKRN